MKKLEKFNEKELKNISKVNGGIDIKIGNVIFTNRLDGDKGNNDKRVLSSASVS